MTHVVIIGGGISGLATAYFLQEQMRQNPRPLTCTLIEAQNRLGGKILTEKINDFIIEAGPDSFITQKPWGLRLCEKLGLTGRLQGTNPKQKQVYVFSGGRLHPLPDGLFLMVPTRLIPFLTTSLISPLGKLRAGLDLLIPASKGGGDESLAGFVRRRMGREILTKIAEPVMAGIYAGEAAHLSLDSTFPLFKELEKKHRSLILGLLARRRTAGRPNSQPPLSLFVTLEGGMEELVRALVSRLDTVRRLTGQQVLKIQALPDKEPAYRLEMGDGSATTAHAVVLTTPAYVTAKLLQPLNADLAQRLEQIPYASTATVTLAFERGACAHPLNGFGFVIPRTEGKQTLACTWTSTKFPHRAPPEHVLMRCFIGGAGRKSATEPDEETLVRTVLEELQAILGIRARPTLSRVYRWPKANPQYTVGHLERLAAVEALLEGHPGLFLTGSPYYGVGIPDCIHAAARTAEKVFQHLKEL